jgi:CheY-specific phosphatase CheX
MNKEALMKAVKASISEVLEKMFFLPLEFAEEKSPAELWPSGSDEGMIAVNLVFQGPFSGRYCFIIPKPSALALTASFLGEDRKQITPEQVAETVKEIINMIAGNTFGIFDEKAVFNLGIPQFVDFKKIKNQNPGADKQILVVVDTLDQTMAFQLILNA